MPEANADASQADDGSKSQADENIDDKAKADDQSDKSQADADKSQAGESLSLAEAKKLRKEAHDQRERAKTAEAALAKIENEKLSETERLKKEKADLEKTVADANAKVLEIDRREAFLAAASDDKRQVKNPRALYRFVKDDIEFTDGKITNFDDLLKQAKSEAPEFFGTKANGSIDGGAGSRDQNPGNDMNAQIRRLAGR